jgi:hypothetical protein
VVIVGLFDDCRFVRPKYGLLDGSLLKSEIGDSAAPTQDASFGALQLFLSILQLPLCSGELTGLNGHLTPPRVGPARPSLSSLSARVSGYAYRQLPWTPVVGRLWRAFARISLNRSKSLRFLILDSNRALLCDEVATLLDYVTTLFFEWWLEQSLFE